MKITTNFTKVPNILFDEIFDTLSDKALRVLLIIIRYSIGYHNNKPLLISYNTLCNKTNKSFNTIKNAIKELAEKNLVIIKKNKGRENSYKINLKAILENGFIEVTNTEEQEFIFEEDMIKKRSTPDQNLGGDMIKKLSTPDQNLINQPDVSNEITNNKKSLKKNLKKDIKKNIKKDEVKTSNNKKIDENQGKKMKQVIQYYIDTSNKANNTNKTFKFTGFEIGQFKNLVTKISNMEDIKIAIDNAFNGYWKDKMSPKRLYNQFSEFYAATNKSTSKKEFNPDDIKCIRERRENDK